ncbi:DUF748 domain-containing protein [Craterilacuibacter sinensis]|uniref:DUF748 domain-containing protein n=1 Tax=Craterilacuibacter sinensis TaxID=2686017 RepID=A0A845BMP8_9NEIS|nr:DUF748 domain-containing protein [Craterilacuibacter sinensis]MXR36670.1 DUF748 domain-containing protein [Craterilacuibacter sinensis]
MNQAAPEHIARPARRWRGLRLLAMTLLALVALLWGALYTLAPRLLQKGAADWAQGIGYKLQLGQVDIAPWAMRAELGDIELSDSQGAPLFAAKRLLINAELWALLAGRWQVSALNLDAPRLTLARDAAGVWNWARLLDAASSQGKKAKTSDDSLPSLLIEALRIRQGVIALDDAGTQGGRAALTPFDLSLNELSTLSGRDGLLQLNARLNDGARLTWQGRVGLSPLASQGELSLQGLKLASVWPWVAPHLRLASPQGSVSLNTRYRFAMPGSKPELVLPHLALQGSDLAFKAPGSGNPLLLKTLDVSGASFVLDGMRARVQGVRLDGLSFNGLRNQQGLLDWQAALPVPDMSRAKSATATPGLSLSLDKLWLKNAQFQLDDAGFIRPLRVSGQLPEASARVRLDSAGAVRVDQVQGQLAALTLQSEEARWLQLSSLALQDLDVDTATRKLDAGTLNLAGLQLDVVQTRGGQINIARYLQQRPGLPTSKAAPASGRAWQTRLPQLTLADSSVRWRDEAMAKPLTLALTGLAGTVTPEEGALALALNGRLEGGQLDLNGRASLENASGQARLALKGVPLQALAPYALAGTPLLLRSGSLATALDARWQEANWSVRGNGDIARLAVMEPGQTQPLLAWQRLQIQGIQADAKRARIAEIRLDKPVARFLLDEKRSSNVEKLFAGKMATARPAAAKQGPGYAVDIASVRVIQGDLEFSDQGMKPAFATRMHDLNGSVLGISSRAGRRASLSFNGEVDRYGDVRIKGALSPQAVTDDLDIALAFRNIPIHSLNPYSMSFAGWQVDDGRLSLDVSYRLDRRALKAENRVVIDSLKLGEELPDYKGTRLPLRLAIALLEDGDGRIDLDLPVSGSLDDPEFSVGHLVWQAVKNVVTKVATAPFRALGALLGGEGFDAVYAVPGEAAVSPPEREKLDQLATLLQKRPQLKLEIAGRYAEADRKALARSRIDRAILAAGRFQLLPGEPLPLPDMGDPVMQDAVKSVYVDKIGRIKLMQRLLALPDNDARYQALREEMIAATPVADAELATLAQARAAAARAIMLEVDAALAGRITLGAADKAGSDANGVELGIKLDTAGA